MKTNRLILLLVSLLMFSVDIFSQVKPKSSATTIPQRCGTMEAIEKRLQTDPVYRKWYEETRLQAQLSVEQYRKNNPQSTGTYRTNLTSIVVIPVVVHIVLPNPEIVTDDDVQFFINQLNDDYAGTNADSTNAVSFYPVRGHSLIRFSLAKRDPAGNYTNGIERKMGGAKIQTSEPQPVKSVSTGGLAPWNTSEYYNLWVAEAEGSLLGIAPEIGPGTSDNDGVCVDYRAFAANPCYTYAAFAKARTAVHEIGHNFGLYHTFQNGCSTSNDFGQLSSVGCLLPPELLDVSDDTPAQSTSTSGCPSGNQASGCTISPNPPGKLYQDYMDYTNDPCYSMFTAAQVNRMHWVLENCRAGYLTSQGCVVPPGTPAVDASPVAVVNPGGSEAIGCNSYIYPTLTCPGDITNIKVRIQNKGTADINSISVSFSFNGTPAGTQTLSGLSVKGGASLVVTFPGTYSFAGGTNTLQFTINTVNGSSDAVPANNVLTQTYDIVTTGLSLPLSQDFSSTAFPPSGWAVINPDNAISWGRAASAYFSTPASAEINIYNYETLDETDILRSPAIDVSGGLDSLKISFEVSHSGFATGYGPDTLELVYSPDCGANWYNLGGYKKWTNGPGGQNLSTSSNTTSDYTPVSASQWRKETVSAKAGFIGNPDKIFIGWKATNGYGNNIYIDDIMIDKVVLASVDAGITAISELSARECKNTASPQLVFRNNGSQPITSLKINYQVDAGPITTFDWTGTLASGAQATYTISNLNIGTAGSHTLKAFTSEPNALAVDGNPQNDSLVKPYNVYTIAALGSGIQEDFTGSFPPSGWEINNPDNDITWEKNSSYGNKSPGSAWVNDWNNASFRRMDDMILPNLKYSGIDSLFLTFNVAAATYTMSGGGDVDTLTVLLSKDCGNTYIPVYQKSGSELSTVPGTYTTEFFPATGQWRQDSIYLGQWLSGSEDLFNLAFRFTGNYENNVFVDDINLYPEILPARLKQDGYLILPNPFNNQFSVWHYQTPTSLKYITVYNSAGQLVWKKQFNGNAQRLINIDLSGRSAGVYIVNIGYTDGTKNIRQQLIKY